MTISRDKQRVDDNQDARLVGTPRTPPSTRPSNFTNTDASVYTIKLTAKPPSSLMSSSSHWRSQWEYCCITINYYVPFLRASNTSFKSRRRDKRSFFSPTVFTRIFAERRFICYVLLRCDDEKCTSLHFLRFILPLARIWYENVHRQRRRKSSVVANEPRHCLTRPGSVSHRRVYKFTTSSHKDSLRSAVLYIRSVVPTL